MESVYDLLDQAATAYDAAGGQADPERAHMFAAALDRAKAVAADTDHFLTNVKEG